HDRPQLLTGGSQVIGEAAPPRRGSPLDDAGARERGEALGQEVARDPRKSDLKLAETLAAVQQLAQDERRPALGEDLRATRDRAELAVVRHVHKSTPHSPPRKFIFWAFAALSRNRSSRGTKGTWEVRRCVR